MLEELTELEAELGLEMARLSRASAPSGKGHESEYRGWPLCWWRFKLLCWTHAQTRLRGHASDPLPGPRAVLMGWDDVSFSSSFATQAWVAGDQPAVLAGLGRPSSPHADARCCWSCAIVASSLV